MVRTGLTGERPAAASTTAQGTGQNDVIDVTDVSTAATTRTPNDREKPLSGRSHVTTSATTATSAREATNAATPLPRRYGRAGARTRRTPRRCSGPDQTRHEASGPPGPGFYSEHMLSRTG